MINLLTFDIEDWYHPTLAYGDSLDTKNIEPRVVEPTLRILNMLEQTKNRATFFVLGEVAEKFPDLVKAMIDQGHEVASHGFCHDLVYDYTKYQFETDIKKSVEVLEGITNQKVQGYRAPSWSLNSHTDWAWEILHEHGFQYDSSLYPFETYLYGDNSSPRFQYEIELKDGEKLIEIPPSALEVMQKRLPFSGGFFLRIFPLWYIYRGIRQYNNQQKPAVMYLHPWELDVEQPRLTLKAKDRFILYANLKNTEKKLRRLLQKIKFTSIKEYLSLLGCSPNSFSQVLPSSEVA
ncbi:MAG: XrtA system polysaccharide deacetylase [bacterium]